VTVVLRVLSSPARGREGGVGRVVVDRGVGRPRGRSASEDGRNGRKGDTIANTRARVDAGRRGGEGGG